MFSRLRTTFQALREPHPLDYPATWDEAAGYSMITDWVRAHFEAFWGQVALVAALQALSEAEWNARTVGHVDTSWWQSHRIFYWLGTALG